MNFKTFKNSCIDEGTFREYIHLKTYTSSNKLLFTILKGNVSRINMIAFSFLKNITLALDETTRKLNQYSKNS